MCHPKKVSCPLSIYWKRFLSIKIERFICMSLVYSSIEEAISVWSCSCLIVVYSFRNTNLNFECAWPSIQNIHKSEEEGEQEKKNVWKRSKRVQFVFCSICFAVPIKRLCFQLKCRARLNSTMLMIHIKNNEFPVHIAHSFHAIDFYSFFLIAVAILMLCHVRRKARKVFFFWVAFSSF